MQAEPEKCFARRSRLAAAVWLPPLGGPAHVTGRCERAKPTSPVLLHSEFAPVQDGQRSVENNRGRGSPRHRIMLYQADLSGRPASDRHSALSTGPLSGGLHIQADNLWAT